jgi:tRNA (adenine22-N1)-methyltransferase
VDVGTDHALLPRFLHARGDLERIIATDVAEGPLAAAARTLANAPGVELRKGDGLEPITPGEVDTIVLAGMGGGRMCQILGTRPLVWREARAVIVQPNTDWARVRHWLVDNGAAIADEDMTREAGHFYLTIRALPSRVPAPLSRTDALLGPRLRNARPDAWLSWLALEHLRLRDAIEAAGAAASPVLRENLRLVEAALSSSAQPS